MHYQCKRDKWRYIAAVLGSLGLASFSTAVCAAPQVEVGTGYSGGEETAHAERDVMTVTARLPKVRLQAGSQHTVDSQQLEKKGANDFGSVMRYEPLIGATGAGNGSGSGKSGFDRGGYTGYNIRGLESNRVGLAVDGIPLPDATGRGYAGRAGLDTFGIGRDYIDPYMYSVVDIQAGVTSVSTANTAIGGEVSFLPKLPEHYLTLDKTSYFGYRSGYDSANRSWHNGVTAAAGDDVLSGIIIVSRRDGQQTSNNSGSVDANPANWHSNAVQASAVWRTNDAHKLTGTVDYYDKTNHSHYPTWNRRGNTILGTAQQQNNTRRWGLSFKDDWTPFNDVIDTMSAKAYYQQTQAHDNTLMPTNNVIPMSLIQWERVYSNYNVETWGAELALNKSAGRHALSGGLNTRTAQTERPFRQSPTPSAVGIVMQPEANSKMQALGGYIQDEIEFDLGGNRLAVVPGGRLAYQSTRAENLSDMASSSLSASDINSLYGSRNSDTQLLPSLSLEYDIRPGLMTYLQYRRGAQFPNASQLYGSWNLSSNYSPRQYALIGNTDLDTETSDNLEWGMKGEPFEGVSISSALFYNDYKDFIAYSRYTRAGSSAMFNRVPRNIHIVYQSENRDRAYIYGGQLSARINIGHWFKSVEGLSAVAAYGYSEGKSKSSYLGDKYVDMDSVAPMKAVFGLSWDDPAKRYGASVTSTFVKGKRAAATNRESYANAGAPLTDSSTEYMRVPGYGLVDMTAYWQIVKGVRLNGGVYNVGDRKYWDYLSSRELAQVTLQDNYNKALSVMPGRTWQMGISVDF